MGFAAMEIVAGYAGSSARGGEGQPILGKMTASDSMAAPGTSSAIAPSADASRGRPIFYLLAKADSYAAVGANPSAAAGNPRVPVQANVPLPIYAEPGDKVDWAAA